MNFYEDMHTLQHGIRTALPFIAVSLKFFISKERWSRNLLSYLTTQFADSTCTNLEIEITGI